MHILQALLLGIIQGLTEFMPISSSGHLILVEKIFNFSTGGLTFDVMLHFGTLLALLTYFWKDLVKIARDMFKPGGSKLGWYIALATVPGVIAGVLLESAAEDAFRSVTLVAINLGVVGLLLLGAERVAQKYKFKDIKLRSSLAIGAAQALALIPGVSRSGITMIAGRLQGFTRESAARFAFLLAIPITSGAIAKQLFSSNLNEVTGNLDVFAVGVIAAAVSGYLTIKFLLVFLSKHSLNVFAYYRLGLAAIVLLFVII